MRARADALLPGFLVSALVAVSGQFISDHYGAPAMLMALLFGIALNFLSQDGKCVQGIEFSARAVLRFGIALLGLRISVGMVAELGLPIVGLIIGSLLATIAFGFLVAPLFGHRYRFAFLSSGSVAICGASAAIAIAAILPRDERSEERLVFTVVGVTLLSTLAMILYPILAVQIGFNDFGMGIFLGATIHDVAQVVGAGFSVSEQTGELATLVKLIRVAMLAPVVVIASMIIWSRHSGAVASDKRPPFLPLFVVGFVVLAALNSFGVIPAVITEFTASISRWALLTAIAAVGMKTSLHDIFKVGGAAVALLVAETLFLAGFVTTGVLLLGA
jgi:uncharacterized integral membrane protein (TIGR00698 family)